MKLVLMRHGHAVPDTATDAERHLSSAGRDEVREAGMKLGGSEIAVEAVFSSPYIRAMQTASLMSEILCIEGPVYTLPELTPDSVPSVAMQALERQLHDTTPVLLVTHQPIISRLIFWLCEKEQPMDTASVAILECSTLEQGCGEMLCVF